MTKDQKRIKALEDEVKSLREQVLQLMMRPVYVPYTAQPTTYPLNPNYVPPYTITCGTSGNTQSYTTFSGATGKAFSN